MTKIDKFDGRFRFLSNFHPSIIEKDGIKYPTNEHFYVSQKIDKPQWITDPRTEKMKLYDVASARELISKVDTPGNVKRMGRKFILRKNWDEVKDNVMLYGIRQKFKDEKLKQLLLDTGDAELIEGNNWHDVYFGICYCPKCAGQGQNKLGKLLMQVRKEIIEAEKSKSLF